MTITAIALAALLAMPAAKHSEFAPINVGEGVTYPLPPVPLPAVQAPEGGQWTETQDSPALRMSRAWMKLGQAAQVERSDATKSRFQEWRSETARNGAHSKASQAAHAKFLASYSSDLRRARKLYETVLEEVDSMAGDAPAGANGPAVGGESTANALAREAEEHMRAAERDLRMTDSACFLSPDTCVPPDPADKALEDEIGALVKDTLGDGGPDGSLNLRALRRKAGLLALRSRVMLAVTQRAAARVAIDVATQSDGNGAPKTLLSPLGPQQQQASRAAAYHPSDPYAK